MIETEKWWNTKGRDMMRHREYSEDCRLQQENLNATNPGHRNYIGNSGILKGLAWSDLSPEEKKRVDTVWNTVNNG